MGGNPESEMVNQGHYRDLARRITRAMVLEYAALALLKKDNRTLEDRDTLELSLIHI